METEMPVEIAQSAPSLPVSDNATFTPAAVAAPQTAPEQGSEVADEEKDFIDEFCDYYGEWNKRGAANGWWGTLGYFGAQTIYAAEFLGDVFADFLGLKQSKYQFAVNVYERRQRQMAQEAQEAEAEAKALEEQEAKEIASLEGGLEMDIVNKRDNQE